jgi:hypothetical protein
MGSDAAIKDAARKRQAKMEEITVTVGGGGSKPEMDVSFTGLWIVCPDSDETRSGEPGQDAGAYYGVALTGKGHIAVYTAHCNDGWPAILRHYSDLDAAESDGIPADILAIAAYELGEARPLRLDI